MHLWSYRYWNQLLRLNFEYQYLLHLQPTFPAPFLSGIDFIVMLSFLGTCLGSRIVTDLVWFYITIKVLGGVMWTFWRCKVMFLKLCFASALQTLQRKYSVWISQLPFRLALGAKIVSPDLVRNFIKWSVVQCSIKLLLVSKTMAQLDSGQILKLGHKFCIQMELTPPHTDRIDPCNPSN